MVKILRNARFASKLIISFLFVIVIFVGMAVYSNYAFMEASRIYRHRIDFLGFRVEMILELDQSFTEMRRLMRESFLNQKWMENAGDEQRQLYAQRIAGEYQEVNSFAFRYKDSVMNDPKFAGDNESIRIEAMSNLLTYVAMVYGLFLEGANADSFDSFDEDRLLLYTGYVDGYIDILRELASNAVQAATEFSDIVLGRIERITFWTVGATLIMLVAVSVLIISSFNASISKYKERVLQISRGDFGSATSGADEVSSTLSGLADTFSRLITEITVIADEHNHGGTRINTIGYEGVYKDTTEAINSLLDAIDAEKDANEHMQKITMEANERNELMLDGAPVACFLIDSRFEAKSCNKEAVRFFGFDGVEDGAAKFREVFSRHHEEAIREYFSYAMEHGYSRFEWALENIGGELIPCEITFIRFSLQGEIVVAAYVFDISALHQMMEEKLRVERAEENSLAKSRFLARMSHEIRTPISAVLGISEIQLQNTALPLEIEEAFAKIYNSGNTLLGIVNDILDLSKIEAGKLSITPGDYELASLISDVAQLNLVYMGSKKIKFYIDVDENLPSHLTGDELRIKQVLNNLLSNAFKYTEEGTVAFSVKGAASQGEGRVLEFTIRDSGRGMTEEQVQSLFDEYSRFHEAEARYVKGTGLGMSIAISLLELMEGTIDVKSAVGEGTGITVKIPQKVVGTERLGVETAENLKQFNWSGRAANMLNFVREPMPYGRVLVVDDIDTNLYVAKGLLKPYKLQVETVNNGYEAVAKVKDGEIYDIIFMDQMMPGMTGMETTQVLRDGGYNAPIVALTANALVGQSEEFLKNRFDGFISKPIQSVHLDAILNKFIRDKQPPEVLEAAKTSAETAEAAMPVQISEEDGLDDYYSDPEVVALIRADFIETQSGVMDEIRQAIDGGDTQTAHRLAHTLKGLASMLAEAELTALSQEAEKLLKAGTIPGDDLMNSLENALHAVLEKIQ